MKKLFFPSIIIMMILIMMIPKRSSEDKKNMADITNTITPEITITASPPSPTVIMPAEQNKDDNNAAPVISNHAKETSSYNKLTKESLSELISGTVIDVSENKEDIVKTAFYYEKLDNNLKSRIQGKSYKDDCTVPYGDLRYVRVLYYGFDKRTHIGELIVNKQLAKDVITIFKELYLEKYPIERMHLIDDYDGDDEASMADNNTSAFNYRAISGSNNLSKHALGLAIDINPLYNPYVKVTGSKVIISPDEGVEYQDRSLDNPYYIVENDICYNAFIKRGFNWGGSWKSLKDYQHFEKPIE